MWFKLSWVILNFSDDLPLHSTTGVNWFKAHNILQEVQSYSQSLVSDPETKRLTSCYRTDDSRKSSLKGASHNWHLTLFPISKRGILWKRLCNQSIVRIAFLSFLIDLQIKYPNVPVKGLFLLNRWPTNSLWGIGKSSWVVSILNISIRNKGFTSQI